MKDNNFLKMGINKKLSKEFDTLCYEYFIGELQQRRYCRFYIGRMANYSQNFSKVFFNELIKKRYNKNKTRFAYLDDFHPNGRGQEALNESRKDCGSKILNEILKDCNKNNVKLIFAFASTGSSKNFFIEKHKWNQAYPKKRGICFKEVF